MPPAVSSSACVNWLGFFLFFAAIVDLLYQAFLYRPSDRDSICREPTLCNVAQRRQFVIIHVRPYVLGEAEQKHGPCPGAVGDQHAIAARPSLPRPRHALLDDTAAQIGIHPALLGPPDRLAEPSVGHPFPVRKPGELLGS